MRIGISLLIASTLLLLQGCAAVVATTEAAKIVGKTTVGAVKATAKVVTWPVREAVKIHKESQKAETPPVTTVQHGQADAKPTRTASSSSSSSSSAVTTTDGDIKLANATDEDEDTDKDPAPPPSRRKKSGSSTSSSSGRVADPEDSSLDDPPPTTRKARQASVKSSDDDDDSDLNGTAKPAKKAPNWRSKKAVSADSSDPDTIRIQ